MINQETLTEAIARKAPKMQRALADHPKFQGDKTAVEMQCMPTLSYTNGGLLSRHERTAQ